MIKWYFIAPGIALLFLLTIIEYMGMESANQFEKVIAGVCLVFPHKTFTSTPIMLRLSMFLARYNCDCLHSRCEKCASTPKYDKSKRQHKIPLSQETKPCGANSSTRSSICYSKCLVFGL